MASILPDLPPDVSTPEMTHGHILVIDDEPDIRESLEVLLSSEGYRVEWAMLRSPCSPESCAVSAGTR